MPSNHRIRLDDNQRLAPPFPDSRDPDPEQSIRPSKPQSFVIAVGGGDFVIGEFEDPDGRPFIMIVNKDLHRSTKFSVKFKEPGTILQTNSYTGVTEPWVGENMYLAAGQGMLLSWKK
jgi:hypothetical protein